MTSPDLATVVLAAGAGDRLAPLTQLLPKALCPVGNRALVDHALDRVEAVLGPVGGVLDAAHVAVNAHHRREPLVEHLSGRVHVSVEAAQALGTAGGVGNLASWIDGRDVLVANADAWFDAPAAAEVLATFAAGWDRRRVRLLCTPAGNRRADFGDRRYAGMCLLPAEVAARLGPAPAGLYEAVWRDEATAGRLDLVTFGGRFVDCGTPADYLLANLLEIRLQAGPGGSLVAPDAVAAGDVEVVSSAVGHGAFLGAGSRLVEAVVWPDSVVRSKESLRRAVRAGGLTVVVR